MRFPEGRPVFRVGSCLTRSLKAHSSRAMVMQTMEQLLKPGCRSAEPSEIA